MDFPIINLLSHKQSQQWLEEHFHPEGLKCPRCGASREQAFEFRQTECSQLTVYRCRQCGQTYNLYSGTIFARRQLTAPQTVLLMRGVLQGESSAQLSRELGLSRRTVMRIRQPIQRQAEQAQAKTPLSDTQTEADEMFQNAGEKRRAAS